MKSKAKRCASVRGEIQFADASGCAFAAGSADGVLGCHARVGSVRYSCREPREAYIRKLLQPKTWGGGVELALFAAHFRTEIWCWDVKHGVCHRFGEDAAYPTLWVLSYAGM